MRWARRRRNGQHDGDRRHAEHQRRDDDGGRTLDTNGVLQGTGTSGLSGTLTLANATHTITATTAGTDVLTGVGEEHHGFRWLQQDRCG